MNLNGISQVLVVKPSSLGDIVHALPVVEALKRRYPQWEISWVANTEWMPLLEGNEALERVVEFPRAQLRGLKGSAGFLKWGKELREVADFELCLDFQGLMRSAMIAKASGARVCLGLDDAREGAGLFYWQRVVTKGKLHAVERYAALGEICWSGLGDLSRLELPHLPEGNCPQAAVGEGLEQGGFVVLHPWSRGEGKSLGPKEIEIFCREVGPRRVVLVGRVAPELVPPDLPTNVLDLSNQTSLGELCWLLARAGATVSVDSGPMHLAAAFPAPLLGLHAWSDPRKVGPWKEDAAVWKAGVLTSRTEIDVDLAQANGVLDEAAARGAAAWVEEVLPE